MIQLPPVYMCMHSLAAACANWSGSQYTHVSAAHHPASRFELQQVCQHVICNHNIHHLKKAVTLAHAQDYFSRGGGGGGALDPPLTLRKALRL